jgi:hypothetical protein
MGSTKDKLRELELTCRLWIAANEAKDQRIQELEAECRRLRSRVARLLASAHRHHTGGGLGLVLGAG